MLTWKIYQVIPHTLWILKCLPCRLEWLKSGTVLTPSHHYPLWSILGVFVIFANENIAHTSPQMVPSSHSIVFVSLPRHSCFALHPTSNRLMWSLGRIRVKHTCIAYIAKSNNGSMEKISYTQIKVCMYVEMGWSWLLHSNDSFLHPLFETGLVFFARLWIKMRPHIFLCTFMCPHFFSFFQYYSPCFI